MLLVSKTKGKEFQMLQLCISRQMFKHLPLLSGWSNTRTSFGPSAVNAIEYDTGGFGK